MGKRFRVLPLLLFCFLLPLISSFIAREIVLDNELRQEGIVASQRLEMIEQQFALPLDFIENNLLPLILSDPALLSVDENDASTTVNELMQRISRQPSVIGSFIFTKNEIILYQQGELKRETGLLDNIRGLNRGASFQDFILESDSKMLTYITSKKIPSARGNNRIGIMVNLSAIQNDLSLRWPRLGETLLVSDGNGIVILSSNPSYLLSTFTYLPYVLRQKLYQDVGGASLTNHLGVITVDGDNLVQMHRSNDSKGYLVNSRPVKNYNLRIHRMVSLDPMVLTANVYASAVFTSWIGGLLTIFYLLEKRRSRRLEVKQLELIKESEEHKHQIIEASAAGLLTFHPSGKIDSVNETARLMFGVTDNKLPGLIDEFFLKYRVRDLCTLAEYESVIQKEAVARRVNGSEFPVEVSVRKMAQGGSELLLLTMRDLSKQKETESELRQNQKLVAMGMMSAMLTHEINQPITAINMEAKLGKNLLDSGVNDGIGECLTAIRSHTEALAGITSQLRQFARKRNLMTKKGCLVYEIIQEVHILFKNRLDQEGIKWREVADQPETIVMIDRHEIYQLLSNLVRNACDVLFGFENKEIHVNLQCLPNNIRIEVCDTGPGVEKDVEDKMFEPFVSSKDGIDSMGLGLSICRDITSRNRGTLQYLRVDGMTVFRAEFENQESV